MPAADEEAFPDIQVLRQQRNEAKAILYDFDCWILMQKFESCRLNRPVSL